MIDQKLVAWGRSGNIIREIAEYGAEQAKIVGPENVYNFTIGSPSIDPPACVFETMDRLRATVPAHELHTYAPAVGLPEVREKAAECPTVPDTFQLDLEAAERALTPDTMLLIMNSPNNPSGVVLRREGLEGLARLLERKQKEYGHPIYIVADEPYRDLVYDGQEVVYLPSIYKNSIYCYSFSKSMSLPGERVGFMALPQNLDDYDDIYSASLAAIRAFGYICVSTMWQRVAIDCLGATSDISIYKGNRDRLYGALTEMGYTCVYPDGAFYLFMKTPEPDAEAFCRRAMKDNLLVVPGDSFGTPGYVRLAYCVSPEVIERALPTFRKLAEEYGLKAKK